MIEARNGREVAPALILSGQVYIGSPEGQGILLAAEDIAREIHRELGDARWALDSARSELRKAQPSTGYRSTAKLGDKPWDVAQAQAKVDKAQVALLRVLLKHDLVAAALPDGAIIGEVVSA